MAASAVGTSNFDIRVHSTSFDGVEIVPNILSMNSDLIRLESINQHQFFSLGWNSWLPRRLAGRIPNSTMFMLFKGNYSVAISVDFTKSAKLFPFYEPAKFY